MFKFLLGAIIAGHPYAVGISNKAYPTNDACNAAMAEKVVPLGLVLSVQTEHPVNVTAECLPAAEADAKYEHLKSVLVTPK